MYYLVSMFMLFGIAALFNKTDLGAKENIERAENYMKSKDYKSASYLLSEIDSSSSYFTSAQKLKIESDSLFDIKKKEEELAAAAEKKNKAAAELIQKKEQVNREITSIEKGIDFSKYRGSMEMIQAELLLFGTWAALITESEKSENQDLKKQAARLKRRVVRLQIKEFPKMRKEYSAILAKKMWVEDIIISARGTGYKYLNITGAAFAANKNKQAFQEDVHLVFNKFRFKQTRYRWYKGQDEYTSYTVFKGKDSDIIDYTSQ